ncbi:MAG TPA: HEAT repeat domain-containing protein, partial [Kofleriaceae bacterium]|nr:HEAT repeat domain-containing protein [Kofleriaceae bacterium]
AVAAFLDDAAPAELRRTAIAALGRMGAMSAIDRLGALVLGDPTEAAAALTALTEIRSPAAQGAALAALEHDLEPEVQIAAVRYLAELGALEVLPMLRRLARHDDAEVRIAANLASRALKAERSRDAAERFLVALSEPDRAVRAILARRLRTLAVADVLEQAEVLLGEDAAGVGMLVLFAVDHPSGFRNLFRIGHATAGGAAPAASREARTVALAHRLHALAAVRNLVTHRASAGAATLGAFRHSYYTAFEELVALA